MKKFYTGFLKTALFLNVFIGFASKLRAQEVPVTFRIVNQKNEPVGFASVDVVNRDDTTRREKRVSDSTGVLLFNLTNGKQYIVSITSVNHQPAQKGITVSSRERTFTFSLENVPKTLSTVVVTSSKPLLRQEDDKTIVDPEN